MGSENIYEWLEHSNKSYIKSSLPTELIPFRELEFNELFKLEDNHFADFSRRYVAVRIANKAKAAIDKISEQFGIENSSGRLYILSCALQELYSRYYLDPMDSVKDDTEDFEKAIVDETKLLDVMFQHIMNPQHYNPPKPADASAKQFAEITSITFKAGSAYKISNPLVVRDILNAIAHVYDLNHDNFASRSEELLDNSGNVIFKKLDEFIKTKTIIGLFHLLGGVNINRPTNHELRFIGLFLNASEIPIYKESEVNFENEIGAEEIASLRHYFKRDKKLFVTNRNKKF